MYVWLPGLSLTVVGLFPAGLPSTAMSMPAGVVTMVMTPTSCSARPEFPGGLVGVVVGVGGVTSCGILGVGVVSSDNSILLETV